MLNVRPKRVSRVHTVKNRWIRALHVRRALLVAKVASPAQAVKVQRVARGVKDAKVKGQIAHVTDAGKILVMDVWVSLTLVTVLGRAVERSQAVRVKLLLLLCSILFNTLSVSRA